jgi:hypothetical protein
MADDKQARDDEKQVVERHEDLELPDQTAEQVKGGADGYDIKTNKST